MSYIAHYPLISDMNDIFGHSALSIAGSSFIEEGILGHCLYFKNGSVSYIKLPELEGKKSFSISFRINVPKADALSQWADVFGFQNTAENGGNNLLRLEISGNQAANSASVTLNIFNNGTWTNDGGFGGISITRNEWHHLAFSISEDKVRYYVDGIKKVEQDKTMNFSYSSHSTMNGNFKLGDGQQISFKIYDLQIYSHAISTKEVKKIYQTCVLDYTFSDPMIIYNNIYSGKQANYNSMKVEYNVATDIFKEYGFDTATKFSSDGATIQKWAYSYCLDPKTYENLKLNSEDTALSVSFYAYASDDIDAPICLTSEHGTSITNRYCSGTISESNGNNLACSDTGKVVYFHAIVTPSTLADYLDTVYLMFYFNKGQTNQFTKGYVLIAGLTICPIPTEFSHIMPIGINGTVDNYGIIQDGSGRGYDSTGYNIHSPMLTTDTNIGKYAYRAQNDGSCVYFPLPLNNKNIQGTVEIRIKLYSTKVYQGIIGCSSYGGAGVWISANTEGNALWYYNGSYYRSDNAVLPLSKFTLNTRHQIVAIWKDKSLSWYFDGSFINTITNEKTFAVSDANKTKMHFGGYYPETGSLSWNTKLDAAYSSIKFYAKYLTAEEIKSNYNEVNRLQIDNKGGLHVACLDENYCDKIRIPKRKNITAERLTEFPVQDMEIKVLDDGSAWARIFHHLPNGGTVLFGKDDCIKSKVDGKYSLLYLLNNDNFKNDDNLYEFLLEYPVEFPGKYNRRYQSSNPVNSKTVVGYAAVHIDWTGSNWGGLRLYDTNETFIAGCTTTERYYSIGSRVKRNTSIPGPNGAAISEVCLYVRIDNIGLIDASENNENKCKVYKKMINSYNFNERGN